MVNNGVTTDTEPTLGDLFFLLNTAFTALVVKPPSFLQFYVVGQDEGVPPLNGRHVVVAELLLRGDQSQLGGGLDACLLGCLRNLHLQPLQLSLRERTESRNNYIRL